MIEMNGFSFVGPGLHFGQGKCFIAKGITAGMAGAGKAALVPVALPLALPAAAVGAGSVAAPIALAGAIAGGCYLLWRLRRPISNLSEEDSELLDALAEC